MSNAKFEFSHDHSKLTLSCGCLSISAWSYCGDFCRSALFLPHFSSCSLTHNRVEIPVHLCATSGTSVDLLCCFSSQMNEFFLGWPAPRRRIFQFLEAQTIVGDNNCKSLETVWNPGDEAILCAWIFWGHQTESSWSSSIQVGPGQITRQANVAPAAKMDRLEAYWKVVRDKCDSLEFVLPAVWIHWPPEGKAKRPPVTSYGKCTVCSNAEQLWTSEAGLLSGKMKQCEIKKMQSAEAEISSSSSAQDPQTFDSAWYSMLLLAVRNMLDDRSRLWLHGPCDSIRFHYRDLVTSLQARKRPCSLLSALSLITFQNKDWIQKFIEVPRSGQKYCTESSSTSLVDASVGIETKSIWHPFR